MTAEAIPSHSAPAGRSRELHPLAVQLYDVITSGHDALGYNVDERGAALTVLHDDGARRAVWQGGAEGGPPWQPAREVRQGPKDERGCRPWIEVDRLFNPWVLEQDLRGKYSVAPEAPGWVQWVALDIDAHAAPGSPELVARRLARARADRVLAGVWRALRCSAERQPVILGSPGEGYHLYVPLTRGATSSNPEHTWPAACARTWFARHLAAAGLEIADGVLEVYPCGGRRLRAPCGRGMTLLQATRPDDPDALGLVPWPGTMADQRINWRGSGELSTRVRRVVPMVRTFLQQFEAQRRTPADWLGRPEAEWDATWGFLGWRDTEPGEIPGEISSAGKNSTDLATGEDYESQESDDERGPIGPTRLRRSWVGPGWGREPGQGERSSSSIENEQLPPDPDPDLPPDPVVDRKVRGRTFGKKIRKLLAEGVTEACTRHDAVLSLGFYWGATCGLSDEIVLVRLEGWCRAYPHQGSRLSRRPRAFTATCLREARHYLRHHRPGWRFQGGGAAGLATLTPADHVVICAGDSAVALEVTAILQWLAGRADQDGRITEPVQMSAGLLQRLCGDRRVVRDGKRHRATTLALVALERIGVLTMASNYRVGQRGRLWSCWYRFGSGELPAAVSLPAAKWEAAKPFTKTPLVPTLALAEPRLPEAPSMPTIRVLVLGERLLPAGLVRVLSDGARGLSRTLLVRAPGADAPTPTPSARPPWHERLWDLGPFTPGRLWASDPATVVGIPDIEARRRMTRNERLTWGGGGTGLSRAVALAPVIPLRTPNGETTKPSLAPTSPADGAIAGSGSTPSSSGCSSTLRSSAAAIPASELARGGTSSSRAAATIDGGCASPSISGSVAGLEREDPADPVASVAAPRGNTATAAVPSATPERAELRAELAALAGDAVAAATPSDMLEETCRAWAGFLGRARARGP
jgi:hypothetical protein